MTTQQQIKELEAKLQALKSAVPSKKVAGLTVKIGDKGTVNIYGLGRFPVCLYVSQIQKITELLVNDDFADFLVENKSKLASKE